MIDCSSLEQIVRQSAMLSGITVIAVGIILLAVWRMEYIYKKMKGERR